MGKLDRANADVEALERLASFLGTLFVKHEITEMDEKVLAAAAKRRPKLKGKGIGWWIIVSVVGYVVVTASHTERSVDVAVGCSMSFPWVFSLVHSVVGWMLLLNRSQGTTKRC